MNKKLLVSGAVVLGIVLVFLAIIYFVTPAKSLPAFLPGHEAGSATKHFKHGIASLLLGLGCFAFVWFQSGEKSPKEEKH